MSGKISQASTDSFVDKSLNSLPRSVLAVFGVLFALTIFLVATGFNGALTRVVNAYALRIERAVTSLEDTTTRMTVSETIIAATVKRVDALDIRLRAVEVENDRIHANLRGK
jgi:hypothetical protein